VLHGAGAFEGAGAKRPRSIFFVCLYIYCVYIQKKNMQKDKLVAEYMKTCIFELVDEYIIIKL
jgi:hypothetical protein